MASESLEEKVQRLEKQVQRANDVQEIQNVMARHSLLDAQGKNREQVMEIWSQTMPDVCFCCHKSTIYKGLDQIIHYYCDNWEKKFLPQMLEAITGIFPEIPKDPANSKIGFMKMHSCATPFIVVAGDGKTAKGTWESPGFVTMPTKEKIDALWMWERFAVDFIKEDGKWKIWHFLAMIQIATPYEKNWVQSALEMPMDQKGMDQSEDAEIEPQLKEPFNEPYNPRKLCGPLTPNFPPQPVPYETFSETFSYVPQ